jgi:thiol:disulfide interchange protein DsbC
MEVFLKAFRYAFLGFAFTILLGGSAHAFKDGGESCVKCHNLEAKDVAPILEKVNLQEAKVLAVQMSPIKGLWEVSVENKGQRFVVYVDFSKKYISPGPFIDYVNRKDITRARADQLNKDRKIDLTKLSLQNALIVGKTDAPIRVAVFTDPG